MLSSEGSSSQSASSKSILIPNSSSNSNSSRINSPNSTSHSNAESSISDISESECIHSSNSQFDNSVSDDCEIAVLTQNTTLEHSSDASENSAIHSNSDVINESDHVDSPYSTESSSIADEDFVLSVPEVPPTQKRLTHDPGKLEKLIHKKWKSFHSHRDKQKLTQEQQWEQIAAPYSSTCEYVLKKTILIEGKHKVLSDDKWNDINAQNVKVRKYKKKQFSINALTLAGCVLEEFIKNEMRQLINQRPNSNNHLPQFGFEEIKPYPIFQTEQQMEQPE